MPAEVVSSPGADENPAARETPGAKGPGAEGAAVAAEGAEAGGTRVRLLPGPESFRVDELLAYELCGSGEHLYARIEKRDLTTDMLSSALAKACGCSARSIGFAGRKDRQAVTTQWFSIVGAQPAMLESLPERTGGRARVLEVTRHRNKLRLGHLRGNRFELRLAAPQPEAALELLGARARELMRCGMPNRFGPQRFGRAKSNLRIARALAEQRPLEALRWLIDPRGRWTPGDALPPGRRRGVEGRIRASLERAPQDGERALRAAGRGFHLLVASAAQSAIFNAVLDARTAAGVLHRPRVGDVVRKIRAGAFVCRAEDLDDVTERARPGRLEVLMTGPLPGTQRLMPSPEISSEERAWSAETGMDWSWFERGGVFESPGERRSLVIEFLEAPELALEGADVLVLRVALPRGAYATELLAELGVAGASRGQGSAASRPPPSEAPFAMLPE